MSSISVVIPVYNASATIERCLDALSRVSLPLAEIICVDDGSTDNCCRIIAGKIKGNPIIRLIEAKHGGPAAARNRGAMSAVGDFLYFVDSDIAVNPGDLAVFIGVLHDKAVGCVGGMMTVEESAGYWADFMQYQCYSAKINKIFFSIPNTSNLLVRKEFFFQIGSFDEAFKFPAGEDFDFCFRVKRLGYQAVMLDNVSVVHLHRFTFGSVLRRAFFYEHEGIKCHAKNMRVDAKAVIMALMLIPQVFVIFIVYPFRYKIMGVLYALTRIWGRFCGGIAYFFRVRRV